jgi:putative CocE/NonD family hydrolase
MDAGTADSAIARFRSSPEVPMEIWITANDHHNQTGNDPLRPTDRLPLPSPIKMAAIQRDFVEKLERGAPITRAINYLVLGTELFRRADTWPPTGTAEHVWHFGANGTLVDQPGEPGIDRRDIDLTTSTGPQSRWSFQSGAGPADYQDRVDADRALMTYDSDPMTADMELVGYPVISLTLSTLSTDPALFVYLEDVAPDGRVTFLTEGQFRAIHRKIVEPKDVPYEQGPAPHSFARRDAIETSSGERMQITFALSSVAALMKAGHRLRIAIGGADVHMFERYANGGPERYEIFHGSEHGSTLRMTMRPWSTDID